MGDSEMTQFTIQKNDFNFCSITRKIKGKHSNQTIKLTKNNSDNNTNKICLLEQTVLYKTEALHYRV